MNDSNATDNAVRRTMRDATAVRLASGPFCCLLHLSRAGCVLNASQRCACTAHRGHSMERASSVRHG